MTTNNLLSQLLSRTGESLSDAVSYSNLGQLIRRQGVRGGSEFERIKHLPRRKWEEDPQLDEVIDALTDRLLVNKEPCPGGVWKTRKGGEICSVCWSPRRLRPHQAKGLQELFEYGRLLADFPVGEGKTLVSFLAPVVLALSLDTTVEHIRPLLLLKANLDGKTIREFRALANHWDGCRTIERLSYEKLSRKNQVDFLERFQPLLIMADEAYALKNPRGARAKRIRRYRNNKPEVVFLPLTGTFVKDTVHDYAHLSEWSLRDLSPVPHHEDVAYIELADWGNAVDVSPRETRLAAGVLAELCPSPPESVDDVRAALACRRHETPCWVRVTSSGVDASLTLQGVKFDGYPRHVEEKFKALRNDYETPDGVAFTEPAKLWSYLMCCSSGFWYRYDPLPPEVWKAARREWGAFVRDIINHNKNHWDTGEQITLACANGRLDSGGVYEKWQEVKGLYDLESHKKTEWFDDSFINWCVKWLDEEKSILFTSQIAVGQRLKKLTGLPYFHHGGIDPDHGAIEQWKGGAAIASVDSNKQGRNIQHLWSKACVVGGLSSGPDAEQLIGRLHRTGQEADVVEYTFPYGCFEVFNTLHRAREQAKFADNPLHKLICGDFLVESLLEAERWKGERWSKSS